MYGLYVVNEKKMAVEMKQCIFQPMLVRSEWQNAMKLCKIVNNVFRFAKNLHTTYKPRFLRNSNLKDS